MLLELIRGFINADEKGKRKLYGQLQKLGMDKVTVDMLAAEIAEEDKPIVCGYCGEEREGGTLCPACLEYD